MEKPILQLEHSEDPNEEFLKLEKEAKKSEGPKETKNEDENE